MGQSDGKMKEIERKKKREEKKKERERGQEGLGPEKKDNKEEEEGDKEEEEEDKKEDKYRFIRSFSWSWLSVTPRVSDCERRKLKSVRKRHQELFPAM